MTIQMDAIASASSASWYHSGTPKLSCKQCLCIYKAPCLARACWAQPKPVVLHRADAGFAFLQNALSALRRSAQPSRFRDVHRDWDCIPTSRIRTANLQCHACLSLCIYRGTACRCNLEQQSYFIISRIFSRIVWSAGSHCTESSSSFVSQRAASASFRTRSPERTSHQKQSIER